MIACRFLMMNNCQLCQLLNIRTILFRDSLLRQADFNCKSSVRSWHFGIEIKGDKAILIFNLLQMETNFLHSDAMAARLRLICVHHELPDISVLLRLTSGMIEE